MRFDEITMFGSFKLEKLSTLPTWTTDDQKRLVLIEDLTNSTYKLYLGDQTAWRRIDFPVEDLTGNEIFVAYDGANFYLTSSLPSQTTHDGKFLKTNGLIAEWVNVVPDDVLPSQTGQTGRFLQTNGSSLKWNDTPSELPSKSGNSGKILTVDTGETTGLKWISVDTAIGLPSKIGHAGEFLTVNDDEDEVLWEDPYPTYTGSGTKYLSNNGTTKTWDELNLVPDPEERSVLMTDGTDIYWDDHIILPEQANNDGYVLTTNGVYPSWTDVSDKFWIEEDTTWIVPTNYSTIQDAITALDDYYVHPKATLTIQLLNGTHNIASQISISNRGKGEGTILIKGTDTVSTIITSSDFGGFDSFNSFFNLTSSHIEFEKLTINGNITSLTNGIKGIIQSHIKLTNVFLNNFGGYGAWCDSNSTGWIYTSGFSGCITGNIASSTNSYILVASTLISDATVGCYIESGKMDIAGCTIEDNTDGIIVTNNGSIVSYASTELNNNTGFAAQIKNGSSGIFNKKVNTIDTITYMSGTNGIYIWGRSYCDCRYMNSTVTGVELTANIMSTGYISDSNISITSPVIETVGNYNSIIV